MAAESESLEKRCKGNESPLLHFWQMYCVSGIAEHECLTGVLGSAPLRHPGLWPKECPMEFKEYDFTRNPVVQCEVFFLQSKCTACGFSILVRSVEELVEHEKLHRTQCSSSNAAA
jgi:hypothetical protein